MKRIFKIMKSYWSISTSFKIFVPMYTFIFILMVPMTCIGIREEIIKYATKNLAFRFSSMCAEILNVMNFSFILMSTCIISIDSVNKAKRKSNYNSFLLQAPVSKKDIFNTKYLLLFIAFIPNLIIVIFFMGLNIFICDTAVINAYAGFLVIIYCIWYLLASLGIGFSSLSIKKYGKLTFISILPVFFTMVFLIYNVSIPFLDPDTIANNEIMYNALGKGFAPILKACKYFGGIQGLVIIIITIIAGYYLATKLPLKLSENER